MSEVAYEAVIGMECHVELKTDTKMFCGCRNAFGGEPNTYVCPVCLGMPGALPVPNRLAIEHVVRAGLAFGSEVPAFSKFDRKNYFYPDMPKDYQISQYDLPFTSGGTVRFWLDDGSERSVRLSRIHLEEDTGKSLHMGSSDGRLAGSTYSLVDFNRAGVPLMECVSEPDLRSAEEAVAYLEALKRTFVALGVSDVKMEEGSLRCDANVSIRPAGASEYGTKTEIKNMNSFRSVGRAIESEIARQTRVLGEGGRIVQETRGWDESAGTTIVQRSKEQAHDYRYFPDPDLVPFEFAPRDVAFVRDALGPLPQARLERYILRDGLGVTLAHQLVDSPGFADLYDRLREGWPRLTSQAVSNFVLGAVARIVNGKLAEGLDRAAALAPFFVVASQPASPVTGASATSPATGETATSPVTGALIQAFEDRAITSKVYNDAAELIGNGGFANGAALSAYLDENRQVSDLGAIDPLVDEVIAANAQAVADFRGGKEKLMGFFVGQVMKASRGKANPALAEERLRARIAAGG